MPSIGIIANPASGKDIRRLVSYATTIDNQEKVNIVKRIVLAAQAMGIDSVWFMPDTFQIGWTVISDLSRDEKLRAECHILDMPLTATPEDTTKAATKMEEMGVGCAVVLGGDGTSRAAAKGIHRMPLLPLSTGTNTVYPAMTEGTVAGMAAAVIAQLSDIEKCCIRDKRIEVSLNGDFKDIALVDAVISDDLWVGSKAIWEPEKLRHIFVTRCHPASIGFSSVAGCLYVVKDTDDYGLAVDMESPGEKILAPIAAGILSPLEIGRVRIMPIDTPQQIALKADCMVALDGERELRGHKGDMLTFTITKKGPWRVQTRETLEEAARCGFFAAERLLNSK